MTRLITNKVVVPKDYDYVTRDIAVYLGSLDRLNPFSSNIQNLGAPFDMVFETKYTFLELTEIYNEIPISKDAVTYKIIFNINYLNSSGCRFIRFILQPYIDFTFKSQSQILRFIPCLNVECNQYISSGEEDIEIIKTNNITINFIQIDKTKFKTNENGYSIIYDTVTNEIYDDTENGTEPWGEIPTAAEDGIIPSTDNNGARIDKAVVPQDYARLIYSAEKIRPSSLNTEHDLTTLDLSYLPHYDMVGEISCIYTDDGYFEISTNLTGQTKFINSTYILSSGIENMYRLIRIIEKPNLSLINSGNKTIPGVFYSVYLNINETTYANSIVLTLQLKPGEKITTGDAKFAFIFDTKTKEFYNDTENGTELWSNIYNISIGSWDDDVIEL